VKTRDFKALRPWRRVKYLFLPVIIKIMFAKTLTCQGSRRHDPEMVVDLATAAEAARASVCRSLLWPRVSHWATDRSDTAARDAISRLLSEGFLWRTRMMLCLPRMRTDTGGKKRRNVKLTG